MGNIQYRPLLSEIQIRERIAELGKEISRDYKDQTLIVIGVLKGAFIFLADLVRTLDVDVRIEFIGVSSYVGTHSSGQVRITNDLTRDIRGQNILLVEDIIDKGITIDYLLANLKSRQPASIKVCSFLSKPKAHIMACKVDYVGFEISNEFVIGYGLDLDGRYRQIPFVGQVQ